MFNGASAFAADISGWDTGSVTKMVGMFWDADMFNQDLSPWNLASVASLANMFLNADIFSQQLCWTLGSSVDQSDMFDCYAFPPEFCPNPPGSIVDCDVCQAGSYRLAVNNSASKAP